MRDRRDAGAALIAVLLASTLLLVLAGGAVLVAVTELRVAAAWRDGGMALHAAEGGLALALDELGAAPDWRAGLDGRLRARRSDGAPGTRALPGGRLVDLLRQTHLMRCGRPACTTMQERAATAERPWGPNNPRWEPFLHASLASLAGHPDVPDAYVAVWVGDDPSEVDGDPRRDGSGAGAGRFLLRARAWGPHGVARTVEVLAADTPGGLRRLSWREVR